MHGVIAEAYGGKDFNQVVTEMKNFCTEGEMASMHKPGNCAHAMGHALMLLNSHELDKSIEGCNKFDSPAMSYYCSTGVFMEFSDKLIFQEELGLCGTVTRTSLHYPCNTYTEYPAACYKFFLGHIAKDLDGNMGSVISECNKQTHGPSEARMLSCTWCYIFSGYKKKSQIDKFNLHARQSRRKDCLH